jgi:pimeloyl-ACP methyl ester carboxylesterase
MMGDFIIRAADAFGMRHPHLVGPGVGTPSTLFATAAQPGRFPSLVVGGGVSAVPLRLGLLWQELVHNTELELYGPLGGEAIVEAALASITGHTGPEEIHEDYLASSRGERFVAALHYAQSFTHRIPLLADLLPSIHTPVRIVAGADDKLVPNVNAEFLHQRLPVSRLDLIDGAGHFCWEEKPHAYGSLVTQWWQQVGSP